MPLRGDPTTITSRMPAPSKLAILSAFAALYLIWGSTYLAILFAIGTIPPLLMAGARFLLAGSILYGLARWRGAPNGSFANWRAALIIGGCLLLGGNGGVTLAEQYVSSGLASVVVATVPIFIALFAWWAGVAPRPTPIVWLGLVMAMATPTIILATTWAVQAKTPVSADLFMQSVVKRDGALGWHQLCPALQAQEPLSVLTSQVQQQRNAESRQGLTLTMDYIGAHARPQGGQIRTYVVTARLPDGWVAQRTYIVSTQTSGCVDDVNNV